MMYASVHRGYGPTLRANVCEIKTPHSKPDEVYLQLSYEAGTEVTFFGMDRSEVRALANSILDLVGREYGEAAVTDQPVMLSEVETHEGI